jgi:molybdate transport system substrate-binding protein
MAYFRYLLAVLLMSCTLHVQAGQTHVAAASNLRYVLPVLITHFEQQTLHKIVATYAASGTITTQIQHGAPFDVFLSADPKYIEHLIESGHVAGNPIALPQAQLALYRRQDSTLDLDANLLNIKVLLDKGLLNKVAIANPLHAPYGQAAKHALQQAGLWLQIQPHLLMAENATQAVQFSLTSTVDVGFVPYGHVIQKQLASRGQFIKLDAYLPQQAIVLKPSNEAQQFLQFMQTEPAKLIFQQFGFSTEPEITSE